MTILATTQPTAPATPAAPAAAPAAAPEIQSTNVDARAAELVEQIRSGALKDADNDTGEEMAIPAPKPANDTGNDAPADEADKPEPTPEEKERGERLARAREAERKAVESSKKAAEKERLLTERERALEASHKEVATLRQQLEAAHKQFLDPAHLVPLIKKHLAPEDFGQLIIDANDPDKRAEWQVKKQRETDPELKAMREELAEIRREKAHRAAAEQNKGVETQFFEHVRGKAAELPYVARLLAKRPEELLQRANRIADQLHKQNGQVTYDEILPLIERDMSDYASLLATGDAEVPSPQTAVAATADEPSATRARTLTNRTGAGRSTVPNDEAIGSLEDRAAELKRLLRAG